MSTLYLVHFLVLPMAFDDSFRHCTLYPVSTISSEHFEYALFFSNHGESPLNNSVYIAREIKLNYSPPVLENHYNIIVVISS